MTETFYNLVVYLLGGLGGIFIAVLISVIVYTVKQMWGSND